MRRRWRVALLVACLCLAAASLAAAPTVAQDGDGEWINDSGSGAFDVSDHDRYYVELYGATGQPGEDGLAASGGDGGDGAYVAAVIGTSDRSTVYYSTSEEGSNLGWEFGEQGEERDTDGVGDGGNGAGSTGIGWSPDTNDTILEAGGGGGGGGGGDTNSRGGDGGDGGGHDNNGGEGGSGTTLGGEHGGDGEAYLSSFAIELESEIGGSSGDGAIYYEAMDGPTLSNPSPVGGEEFQIRNVTLSVDVDDEIDEPVDVEFIDELQDETIDNVTVDPGETASIDWTANPGRNEWSVEATGADNVNEHIGPFVFYTPSDLQVRDVHDTSLIDDRQIDATFVSGQDVVNERSTSSGELSLENLHDEAQIAELETTGYYDRAVLVTTLHDEQTAYLLNNDTDAVEHRFRLDDYSGQFRPEESTLTLERAVEVDGERRFVPVASDSFGAANEVVVTLEEDVRYRLRVRNEDGLTRLLGDWRAVQAATTELEIGQVNWRSDGETWSWGTKFENTTTDGSENRTGHIQFEYEDPEKRTTAVDVTIHEHRNEDNVLYDETHTGEIGVVSNTIDLEGEQLDASWRVEFEAQRGNDTVSASRTVADQLEITDDPFMDQWTLPIIGLVLVFVAFLFGGVYSAFGGVFVAATATVFWWLGWFEAMTGTILLGALLVAVLWMVGGERPGGGGL